MLWEDWCKWVSLSAGWYVWPVVHASSGKTGVDGWLHWSQGSQTGTSWRGKFAIVFLSVWEKVKVSGLEVVDALIEKWIIVFLPSHTHHYDTRNCSAV